MTAVKRRTVVVYGRLAMQEARLEAARSGHQGAQIMTIEQVAARLAGGFCRPIDGDSLRLAVKEALPKTEMGQLQEIKDLPGMISASAETLKKIWLANINLKQISKTHSRLAALESLETQVMALLPQGMSRPNDLVEAGLKRLNNAPAIFGSVEIVGMTELSPCWRSLLLGLNTVLPVTWNSGPREKPDWLIKTDIQVINSVAHSPDIKVVSASTAYHEAMEAMRWVRSLLASGKAKASEIAIAAASPANYDDYFTALRADANMDIHFVHGVSVVTTWDGQAAAALADVVVRGLTQSRFLRLATLCKTSKAFGQFPEGWRKILPADAPLGTNESWKRFIGRLKKEDWPNGEDHTPALREMVDLLAKGATAAQEIGDTFLAGQGLAIWRKALSAGPASSIDATIEKLKQDDGLEACASVAWMPASALAASPRKFVRLLGLNSSLWPRGIVEDRLLPDHVIPRDQLDPLPVNLADQRDFETIKRTTEQEIVVSLSRRDSEGRQLGRSPLLAGLPDEEYLQRNASPDHAFSETDRLMARSDEFRFDAQAQSANRCWTDWRSEKITPHDGLVRPDHPIIQEILTRTQSANSLRRLLRSPLGFVWTYAFGWKDPDGGEEPLVLDSLSLGDLVHTVLDHALRHLEDNGGLAAAADDQIAAAVDSSIKIIAHEWECDRAIPPRLIWNRTKEDVAILAERALTYGDARHENGRSYAEVAFGGTPPKKGNSAPWDTEESVRIDEAGFAISGYIDRLDISKDRRKATVKDYKTGKLPKDDAQLDGGKELQRCLYSFAVKSLLGKDIEITASLYYPRVNVDRPLNDLEQRLSEITQYLRAARESLVRGVATPGPDSGDKYDDLRLALPANAKAIYAVKKLPSIKKIMGEAAAVWEVK